MTGKSNFGQISKVSTQQNLYHWVGDVTPRCTPSGPWSGKSQFPGILSSLWVCVLWGCNIPFWKPLNKPKNNLEPDFFGLQLETNSGKWRGLQKFCNLAFLHKIHSTYNQILITFNLMKKFNLRFHWGPRPLTRPGKGGLGGASCQKFEIQHFCIEKTPT